MAHPFIEWLYEAITRRPWTTTVSCVGIATLYPELADYTDAELYARDRDEILAEIRQRRAEQAANLARRERQRVA